MSSLGTPIISTSKRDMSQNPNAAARRKALSRLKAKQAGFNSVTIELPSSVLAELRGVASLTGGSIKEVAQFLVRVTAARHRQETEALLSQARELAVKLAEFSPYVAALSMPGAVVRVKGQTYRHEDWRPLAEQLAAIKTTLTRRGWTRARIDEFCADVEPPQKP